MGAKLAVGSRSPSPVEDSEMLSDTLASTALNLIRKYGDDIELIEVLKGNYDPLTGDSEEITEINASKGYASQFSTSQIATGVYGIDDKRILINTPLDINKTWRISHKSYIHEIISIRTISAQNKTIIYEVQARGKM